MLADLVEGVVVVNDLAPPAADEVRTALWAALEASSEAAPPSSSVRQPPAGPAPSTAEGPVAA
ncbi:MAG: hypothetical protein U5R31_02280 [Acidimicrobiia bacterium]|nr:hypothetical protein [Acidimicrobiia bacterium]